MKRIALSSAVYMVVFLASVGPLWAPAGIVCFVDNDYGRQYTGATFSATNGSVSFPMGQAIAGQVMNPTTLARHGFTGVKKGDEIQATWQGGQKFTFMHVPSGKSVEITFPKDKVKLKK
jgi:hypothetical protein